jgi:hypothetical protein
MSDIEPTHYAFAPWAPGHPDYVPPTPDAAAAAWYASPLSAMEHAIEEDQASAEPQSVADLPEWFTEAENRATHGVADAATLDLAPQDDELPQTIETAHDAADDEPIWLDGVVLDGAKWLAGYLGDKNDPRAESNPYSVLELWALQHPRQARAAAAIGRRVFSAGLPIVHFMNRVQTRAQIEQGVDQDIKQGWERELADTDGRPPVPAYEPETPPAVDATVHEGIVEPSVRRPIKIAAHFVDKQKATEQRLKGRLTAYVLGLPDKSQPSASRAAQAWIENHPGSWPVLGVLANVSTTVGDLLPYKFYYLADQLRNAKKRK